MNKTLSLDDITRALEYLNRTEIPEPRYYICPWLEKNKSVSIAGLKCDIERRITDTDGFDYYEVSYNGKGTIYITSQ